MANTSCVLRRMNTGVSRSLQEISPGLRRSRLLRLSYFLRLFLFAAGIGASASVLLELIMQRLEADPQNLRRTSLIVVGGFQGLQDQQALRFPHRRPNANADGIGIVGCGSDGRVSEARRQMLGLDHRSFANDN